MSRTHLHELLFTQARAKQKQGTISPADNWIYIYIYISLHTHTHTQAIYTHTETLPEEFLQTGVTEPVPTGGHLDGLPHRLAAERTLEASLRLLQELVVEAGHVCGARGRFLSLSRGLRVKKKMVQLMPSCFVFPFWEQGAVLGGPFKAKSSSRQSYGALVLRRRSFPIEDSRSSRNDTSPPLGLFWPAGPLSWLRCVQDWHTEHNALPSPSV